MSNVVPIRQPQQPKTGPWGQLHGLEGRIAVAEHNGLQVLLFTDANGKTHILGEKRNG